MQPVVLSELECLLNDHKIGGNERIKIIAICNDMVTNADLLTDVANSLKPIIDGRKESFVVSQSIPALISAVLSVVSKVEYYKTVTEERMRFVLYCILLSSLLKYYPAVLKAIDIDSLRQIYKTCIELVLLIPVKINKKTCLTCLGGTFKIFSFLNKDKVIV